MELMRNFMYSKYSNLRNFMEKDTFGSELTIYGIASGMLLTACAKRRPSYIQQYKKPSHVPNGLITERVPLTGTVCKVMQHDAETLLMLVRQRPWIPIFNASKRKFPVQLAGVKINTNGYAWLQTCLIGRRATFIPMHKKGTKRIDKSIFKKLLLLHPLSKDKGRMTDVSETLLKLRFADYNPDANINALNKKYYDHLKRTEEFAKKREAWRAWAARYPWILNNWHRLKTVVLPKEKLLPEIVRSINKHY